MRRQAIIASVSKRPEHGCVPDDAREKFYSEYYPPEARYVIGYEGDDRDIDDLLREFDLEPRETYFARARRVRRETLARQAAE